MKVTIKSGRLTKGSPKAAAFDMHASERVTLPPHTTKLVPTNLYLKMEGCFGLIRDRSGLAVKKKVTTRGGVIDEDYTGEVGVVLRNESEFTFEINPGDRVAQIIFFPSRWPELYTEGHGMIEFMWNEREEKGFGSTGIN